MNNSLLQVLHDVAVEQDTAQAIRIFVEHIEGLYPDHTVHWPELDTEKLGELEDPILSEGQGITTSPALNEVEQFNLQQTYDILLSLLHSQLRSISHAREAEHTARSSEERYRTLINRSQDMIYQIDPSGLILTANAALCKAVGRDLSDVEGSKIADLFPESTSHNIMDVLAEFFQNPKPANFNTTMPGTQKTRWINSSFTPLSDEDGEVNAVLGISRDITDQVTAQKALEDSEAQLRLIMENTSDNIAISTFELRPKYIYVNESVKQLLGYDPEDLLGKSFFDFVHPDDRKVLLPLLKQYIKLGWKKLIGSKELPLQQTIEYRFLNKQGEYRDSQSVINLANGHILSVTRDISEQKAAHRAVKASERRFRNLYENSPYGIVLCELIRNQKGEVVDYIHLDANASSLEMLELKSEQLIDVPASKMVQKEELQDLCQRYGSVVEEGKPLSYEQHFDIYDKILNVSAFPSQGDEFIINFIDVTERVRARMQLTESEERFALAMQASQDGLYDWNLATNEIYYSPGWKKMLGYQDHELPNDFSVWEKLTSPEDVKRSWEMQSDLINRKRDSFELIFKMKHKAGHWVDILSRANAFFDDSGKAVRMVGTHVDVSDQIQVQDMLRRSEERFALAMEASQDGLYDWNLESNEIYYSPGWKKMLGYEDHELPNDFSIWEQLTEPEDVKRSWEMQQAMIRKERDSFELIFKMKHKDGGWVDILSRANAFFDPTGEAVRIVGTHVDITSRVRIERALRSSERKFRNLYNNAPDMYVSVSPTDASILVCNDTLVERLGYSRAELIGSPIFMVYHEDCMDQVKATFQEFVETGEISGRELILKTKAGDPIDVSLNVHAIRDENGEILYSMSSWRDITSRKQAQEKQAISEERYRLATAASDLGIWDWWTHSTHVYYNSTWKAQLGYEPDELKNEFETWERLLHPEDLDRMLQAVQDFLASSEEFFVEEFRMMHKDGTPRWIYNKAASVRDENGKVLRMFGTHTDITRRTQIEHSLKDQRQHLENVIEGTNAGTWDIDLVNQKIEINDRLLQMIGRKSEDLKSWDLKDLQDVVHSGDWEQVTSAALAHFKGDSPHFEVEFRQIDAEDQVHHVIARGKVSERDEMGRALRMTGTTVDETDRRKLESEHKLVEEQLQQALKLEAIGTMVGGIAHDFNNILQGMFLYAQVLEVELADNEMLSEDLRNLMDGAERARDLVKQILTFSRKSDVDLKSQTIQETVLDALSFVRASLPSNIEIHQDISEASGPVLCDKTQIHQIALNLCNNAHQAIGDQQGTITVSLKEVDVREIAGIQVPGALEFIVSDTGIGMDANTQARIFDPFFTTKGIGEGTGLGLSMIHGIVNMMNGTITVESEPGSGSTFRILIPISDKQDGSGESTALELSLMRSQTILLVDDEEPIRYAGKKILEQIGHLVTVAESGERALDLIFSESEEFDLIITDMTMPGMSGLELCQRLKKEGLKTPVILSTGNLGMDKKQEYDKYGFSGFLQKPWKSEELQERLQQLDVEN